MRVAVGSFRVVPSLLCGAFSTITVVEQSKDQIVVLSPSERADLAYFL
jgi:hypothetical protein